MKKVGIIGGAGYTGGEAIRLLINHLGVDLAWVQSGSNAGNPLIDVHTDLVGDTDLRFVAEPTSEVDVLFICSGHGEARKWLKINELPAETKIIDLSQDFRLRNSSQLDERRFVYGLPELNREQIRQADSIANPGCFATCLQLGMLPLAAAGVLTDDINVCATTGSTGAGQKPTASTHFSWRANNVSTYKEFEHQHLLEIGEAIESLQPSWEGQIDFVPVRGTFTRGIFASIWTRCELPEERLKEIYRDFYRDAAFTIVVDRAPDLKQVVNTNKCLVHVARHGDNVLIISTIDNLLKGASGQAVQNMNLMLGLPEKMGLTLKASAF